MFIGVVAATWDVLLYSHPKGYAQTAGRFLFYTGPLAAMAAGFAATTCVAVSVRGKVTPTTVNRITGIGIKGLLD